MVDDPTHRHASPASAATESVSFSDVIRKRKAPMLVVMALCVMTSIYIGSFFFRTYEAAIEVQIIPAEPGLSPHALGDLVQREAAKIDDPGIVQSAVKSIQAASDTMSPPDRQFLEENIAAVQAKAQPGERRLELVMVTKYPDFGREILAALGKALQEQEDQARRIRVAEPTTRALDDGMRALGKFAMVGAAVGLVLALALALLFTHLDRPRAVITATKQPLEKEPS